jgi:hypothetical protein
MLHVEGRTERLKNGFTSAHGWKTVLDDFDAADICAPNDIFNIQIKCKHVSLALRVAMGDMPGSTWMDCCADHAVKELERVEGFTHIGHARTAQQWHLSFHQNNESFLNPKFHTRGKAMLPPLREQNPDLKKSILQHATSNLNELTAELLLACLHDAALPVLLEKFQEDFGNPVCTMHDLFQEHGLSKLYASTVCRWMRGLGFKHKPRKKCHCVDGHEKPETKAHRKKFVRRCFADEMLMHCSMQMILMEKLRLEEEIELSHGSHHVDAETEAEMVEFHVDDHHRFQDKMNSTTRTGAI